jgi:H+/Cl- antiporter ClcA
VYQFVIWQLLPLVIVTGILGGLFSMATLYLIKKFIAHTKTKVICFIDRLLIDLFRDKTSNKGNH